jgi:cytochrome c oxidase subunit 2
MKLIGWAIALAAVGLTPAAAQAPQANAPATTNAAQPAAVQPAATGVAAVDHSAHAMPAAGATPAAALPVIPPTPGIGVPDGRMGIQDQVTGIGREAQAFHDNWLLLLCAVISIFVLALLGYAMVRFRRSAHPTPNRTTHNTTIEVVWTLIPVLILVAIAIPSIRLLRHQYSPPKADLTVKVIGNQWYWTYQYPDNGDLEIVSNMLKEKSEVKPGQRFRTAADGPPLLAVDERMVIPVGKVVKFIVTSNDVIHSFGVPALWQKMDANPGQLNETWAKVDRPGVYFGQCSELCGARHGYMPIAIEAVSPAQFAAWVASKGGTMPGAAPPRPDSTAISPVSAAAVPAAAQPQPNAGSPPAANPSAVKQPAANQPATAQN